MAKSLIETMEEENKVARAKAEQVQQVKEAVQERTETTKTLIEYQKAVAEQNKTLQENQQILYNAIIEAKKSFDTFESKADTLTQENISALKNTMNDIEVKVNSINENVSRYVASSFDNMVSMITTNINTSVKNLNDQVVKSKNDVKDNYDKFNATIKEKEKELDRNIKSISSNNHFLIISDVILLLIPTIYCLNWQFNFIPSISKPTPINDMFYMGLVCGAVIILVIAFIIKIVYDKIAK